MTIRRVLALAALVPSVAHSIEPLRLQPSSPWVVDYAENSCRLIRTFGPDKSQVKIAFESADTGEMNLVAIGKPLTTFSENISARFLPSGGIQFPGQIGETTTGGVPALFWQQVSFLSLADVAAEKARQDQGKLRPGVRPPPRDPTREAALRAEQESAAAAATELAIQTGPRRAVILETGSLGAPFKAFEQCGQDSLKDWGVDPDVEARIVRPAWAPDRRKWIGVDDYPKGMLMRGQEATLHVRLLIDAAGRPTKCTAISHFNAAFDKISCDRIMERATFQPAELADGTKVPSLYTTGIVFRIAP